MPSQYVPGYIVLDGLLTHEGRKTLQSAIIVQMRKKQINVFKIS